MQTIYILVVSKKFTFASNRNTGNPVTLYEASYFLLIQGNITQVWLVGWRATQPMYTKFYFYVTTMTFLFIEAEKSNMFTTLLLIDAGSQEKYMESITMSKFWWDRTLINLILKLSCLGRNVTVDVDIQSNLCFIHRGNFHFAVLDIRK